MSETTELSIWEDELQLKDIKEIYAPKATANEFKAFIRMGQATGLNPFTREIWCIKYDEKSPAQIFIGRDGFRKSIARNSNYDCHHVDAVYSNDKFQYDFNTGNIEHKSNFKDRGTLVGAYCLTFMKNRSRPFYVFAELSEYNKKRSTWNDIPATMIKKVAESQCLRMASPEQFSGSYDESEQAIIDHSYTKKDGVSSLKQIIQEKKETTNIETGEIIEVQRYSVEELTFMMQNATTLDDLVTAADLARSLPKEIRDELRVIYNEKAEQFNK